RAKAAPGDSRWTSWNWPSALSSPPSAQLPEFLRRLAQTKRDPSQRKKPVDLALRRVIEYGEPLLTAAKMSRDRSIPLAGSSSGSSTRLTIRPPTQGTPSEGGRRMIQALLVSDLKSVKLLRLTLRS